MKKLFFAALIAVTVASSAFAADTKKVNSVTTSNFKSEFKKASEVSWTSTEEFTKATFVLNNQKMEAFYDQNGEMIGTSKAVSLDELPVSAKRSIAKRLSGYTVKEAIEFQGTDELAYYISAENDKETAILKVSDNGTMSNYKTIKK